jgi:hypothetical protein
MFRYIPQVIIGIICLSFSIKFLFLPPLINFPIKYFHIFSAEPFIYALNQIKKNVQDKKTILVHLDDGSEIFITAVHLADRGNININIKFINGIYCFTRRKNYLNFIDKDSIVLSKYNYDTIFNSKKLPDSYAKLYLYDFDRLKELGYAAVIANDNIFGWQFVDQLEIKIRVPDKFIGQDLVFSADVSPIGEVNQACDKIYLGVSNHDNNIIWSNRSINELSASIPSVDLNNNVFTVVLLSDPTWQCPYQLKEILLEPVGGAIRDQAAGS